MAWPLTDRIGRLWLNVPCSSVSVGPVSFTLTPVHAAFWSEHGDQSTVSAHTADGLTELLIEWVSYNATARTAEIRIGGVSVNGITPPGAGSFTGAVMLAWGGVTPRATGAIPPGAATAATIASAAGVTILDGGRAGQQRDTVIMRVGERLKFAYAIPLASYAYPVNGRLDGAEVSWAQFRSRVAPSAVISEDALLVMEHPRYPGVRFVVATVTALASGSDRLDVLVGTLTAGCSADPHDGELQHYSATVTVL
jgi:hypothetical protein